MGDRLCPKCGQFALKYRPGDFKKKGAYVCSFCGASIPEEEIGIRMDEDTMHRFPGNAGEQPKSELQDFLGRKKQ